jgi:hypothetical protein
MLIKSFMLIFMLFIFLPTVVSAQTDKGKLKLLDSELIAEGQPLPAPAPTQPAPENNTSQTVTLLKEFSVTLPANPSTGYGWKVATYNRENFPGHSSGSGTHFLSVLVKLGLNPNSGGSFRRRSPKGGPGPNYGL